MSAGIYRLRDPRNGKTFYIGQAKDPKKRFKQHCDFKGSSNHYLDRWIHIIYLSGLTPILDILETCTEAELDEHEKFWINYGLALEWPLTNRVFGKTGKQRGGRAQVEYIEWLNDQMGWIR